MNPPTDPFGLSTPLHSSAPNRQSSPHIGSKPSGVRDKVRVNFRGLKLIHFVVQEEERGRGPGKRRRKYLLMYGGCCSLWYGGGKYYNGLYFEELER